MNLSTDFEQNQNLHCIVCGSPDITHIGITGGFPLCNCKECGLQFLYPRPSREELKCIYADYYRPWGIDTSGDAVSEMKMRTFRGYMQHVERYAPKGRLLDVGCATGELLSVARNMGFDAYGIEISPKGVEKCRTIFGEGRIASKPLEKGDFPDGSFDVVTLCDVLEHLEAPGDFLAIVATLLKPEGILLIVTPDTSSWTCRLMGASWPHFKKEHLYYFSRTNIIKFLPSALVVMELVGAKKSLSIRYCRNIIEAHNGSTIGARLISFLRFFPRGLQVWPFSVGFGEMLILARKGNVVR
jgi:2-polyprenyl-3-methyl-5-hydroxy-6-metoxy-1,4-benzoquinol methylase